MVEKITFLHKKWLRNPTRKSLVLIPWDMYYGELGGNFGSERFFRHHIVRYVSKI